MAKIKSIAVAACVVAAVCLSAFAEEQHTHTDAAGNTVTFEPIDNYDALTNLFAIGGSGYLTADIAVTRTLSVQADVDLCLNDKVLNLGGNRHIDIRSGVNFALYDCGTTVRHWEADSTGLWKPSESATDDITTGGVITGGKGANGGAFNSQGTFTMYGGNICGNTSSGYGGGLYVYQGTFTMYDGTISGNTSVDAGGGMSVRNGSSFTMVNGTISDNTSRKGGGGAFFLSDSDFLMKDGTVSRNFSGIESMGGGAVYAQYCTNATFTIEKGLFVGNNSGIYAGGALNLRSGNYTIKNITISGNTSGTHGGGVYIYKGALTMENATIVDNTAEQLGGGVYASSAGVLTVKNCTISGNTAGAGGGIQVHETAKLNIVGDDGNSASITGNAATAAEGGIANWGELHLTGKVVVKDNICTATYGDGINGPVNLSTATPLRIDGDLTGSEIYLTHASPVTNKLVSANHQTKISLRLCTTPAF